MTAALEEAYANQKMVGKFPGCVLHLTCKLNAVDVNVHPTKQEVKFGSDKRVFDAVYYAVRSALEADRTRPAAVLEKAPARPAVSADKGRFQTMTAEQYRALAGQTERPAGKQPVRPGVSALERILSGPERKGSLPLHDFTAPRSGAARPPAAPAEPKEERPPRPSEDRADGKKGMTAAPEQKDGGTPKASAAERRDEKAAGSPLPGAESGGREIPEPTEPEPWRIAGEVVNT